jgi:hypothetical protein
MGTLKLSKGFPQKDKLVRRSLLLYFSLRAETRLKYIYIAINMTAYHLR